MRSTLGTFHTLDNIYSISAVDKKCNIQYMVSMVGEIFHFRMMIIEESTIYQIFVEGVTDIANIVVSVGSLIGRRSLSHR